MFFRSLHSRFLWQCYVFHGRLVTMMCKHCVFSGLQLVSRSQCGYYIQCSQLLLQMWKSSSHYGTRRRTKIFIVCISNFFIVSLNKTIQDELWKVIIWETIYPNCSPTVFTPQVAIGYILKFCGHQVFHLYLMFKRHRLP